ncbi:MAG: lytic transglycosylase domain-containing protein [Steroidobacteraceae bacterium]
MLYYRNCRLAWRTSSALLAGVLLGTAPVVLAQAQRDPELRGILAKAIASAECFPDKFDSAVWYTLMEPKLHGVVKDHNERIQILKTAFCEAHRPGEQRLPPGLVLALMDIESHFNRWAVSSAGAVGLMQVMPFWPAELGMQRHELTQVEANMRMGCAILRFYLRREKNDVRKALARYNGSVGRREYPDKVVQRWTTRWNSADDLGLKKKQR